MHFSGIAAVRFFHKIELETEDNELHPKRGFTVVIGCNSVNIRKAFEIICDVVEKEAKTINNNFEIEQIEIQHIDIDDWDENIIKSVKNFEEEIYYLSGKVFYADD